VTGASRGIGERCARAPADEGARVALAARSVDALKRVAVDLDGAIVLEVDLAAEGTGDDLAARAADALGGVGHGSIIHMSSIAGTTGVGELPSYGASKAAID
jgi:short-subunit dehydrogenase